MKQFVHTIMGCMITAAAFAQRIPIEVQVGDQYILYQHTISKPIKPGSRFGVVHLANITDWYNNDVQKNGMKNEVMNQGYISYRLNNAFTVLGGFFYTNAAGLHGSAAVQFMQKGDNWLFVISPRVDLKNDGAVELFGMFEYRPSLSANLKLYTRIQGMTSHGPSHHNRSYQRLRLGLDAWNTQFGFAFTMDEYGAGPVVKTNTGIFLRKEIP